MGLKSREDRWHAWRDAISIQFSAAIHAINDRGRTACALAQTLAHVFSRRRRCPRESIIAFAQSSEFLTRQSRRRRCVSSSNGESLLHESLEGNSRSRGDSRSWSVHQLAIMVIVSLKWNAKMGVSPYKWPYNRIAFVTCTRCTRTGIKRNKHSLVPFPRLSSSWRHSAIPFPGVCCNAANGGRRVREGSGRRSGSTNWGDDREGRATPPRRVGEQRVRGLASARIAPGHGRPPPATAASP